MDLLTDSEAFRELLDGLSLTLTGWAAKDALAQAYFIALRDLPLREVKANIERLLRTATKATKFPHPCELRNEPVSPTADARLAALEERSCRQWRRRMDADPIQTAIELRIARAARKTVITPEDDPARASWDAEYRHWAGLRHAPREQQERALATVSNGVSARDPGRKIP
jgi:hypothetical protein